MPADAVVDAVLQQDGPVHRVCLVQGYVTAVCLCHAANLQHEHDLTANRCEGDIKANIKGCTAYFRVIFEMLCVLVVPVPGSSEVQRFGNCLPHLTAVEVERISVGMRRQLPTAVAYPTTLDQLPALCRHAARLKVVFY